MRRRLMVTTAAALAVLTLAGCEQPQSGGASAEGGEPRVKGDEHGGGNGVPGGVGAPTAQDIREDLRTYPELRDREVTPEPAPDVETSQQRFSPDASSVPEHIRELHRQLGSQAGAYAECAADDSGRVLNYWPSSEWGWRQAVDQCQNPGI